MSIKDFKDLRTWQEAHALALEIYQISATFPDSERYSLTSQIRRAAVSVPSNIAEGMGRNGLKDFVRFLYIARGSVHEVLSQLELAKDLKYIGLEPYNVIVGRYRGLMSGINGHIKSLNPR